MATKKKEEVVMMDIPHIEFALAKIRLVGESPLIMHRWSDKARREMLDKQTGKPSVGKKPPKDPERDFEESMYKHPESTAEKPRYGFPAVAFKAAAVDACAMLDRKVTKVMARGAFHVKGVPSPDGDLVEILGEPRLREDMVRVGQGTADLRYRGEFIEWECTLLIRYNVNVLSLAQIVNLFNVAGFSVGVGEWRPEKNGQNGMFIVEPAS